MTETHWQISGNFKCFSLKKKIFFGWLITSSHLFFNSCKSFVKFSMFKTEFYTSSPVAELATSKLCCCWNMDTKPPEHDTCTINLQAMLIIVYPILQRYIDLLLVFWKLNGMIVWLSFIKVLIWSIWWCRRSSRMWNSGYIGAESPLSGRPRTTIWRLPYTSWSVTHNYWQYCQFWTTAGLDSWLLTLRSRSGYLVALAQTFWFIYGLVRENFTVVTVTRP